MNAWLMPCSSHARLHRRLRRHPGTTKQAVCFRDRSARYHQRLHAARVALACSTRVDRWNSFHDQGYSLFLPSCSSTVDQSGPRARAAANESSCCTVGGIKRLPIQSGLLGSEAMLSEDWVHSLQPRPNQLRRILGGLRVRRTSDRALRSSYGQFGHVGYIVRSNRRMPLAKSRLRQSVERSAIPGKWSGVRFGEARVARLRI